MTIETLNQILKKPSQLQLSDVSLLNDIIEKYPYFQASRAVQLKSLKEQESYLYNQKLKETAAYTIDRGVLFKFITSKVFLEKKIIAIEDQTIENTPLIAEKTSDNSLSIEKKVSKETSAEAIKMTNEEANQIVDPLLFEEKVVSKTATAPIEDSTPILNINTPLDFKKEETHSFSEWLKLASLKPIIRDKKNETVSKKRLIESSLIDNFIKNSPKISPVKKDIPTFNLAKQNMIPMEDLMTETLAKVYVAQKNYKKAIQAYKILSLKNPEKSGLFADQIRAIEKLQNHK